MEKKKILVGLGEIAAYYGRSKATVKELVETNNFPAVKICGRWESNTELIDSYQRNMVASRCEPTAMEQQ